MSTAFGYDQTQNPFDPAYEEYLTDSGEPDTDPDNNPFKAPPAPTPDADDEDDDLEVTQASATTAATFDAATQADVQPAIWGSIDGE